ncbi:tetratricopeptide repeat protein [Candidatus Falkowbacteria bacterium]|nr:tetratricopeptide repeat protein [Candidatus Falkowbacteria bacterium]
MAKYIDNIITYVLCGLLFLLPLYFTPISKTAPGFIINLAIDKVVIFKIFVILLLLLTLIKVFLEKKAVIYGSMKQYLLFLPFFLALGVGTIFSVDQPTSIDGFYWRQQGLITYAFYLLFAILLVFAINKRARAEKIITGLLLGSFFVSVIGILHWLNLDFLKLQKVEHFRPGSTLGQPVFLGNFLVLTTFLAAYKIYAAKNSKLKIFYGFLILSQFACLVLTYSRGAWIGFLVGAMAGAALLLRDRGMNILKRKNLARAGIAALSIFFILGASTIFINRNSDYLLFDRLKSSFNFSVGSVFLRFQYWQGALDLIKKSPVVGYGPETQRILFLDYYNPAWGEQENINAFSDRAHNEYLDVSLAGGVPALLGLLLIFGYLFWTSLKGLPSIEDRTDRLLAIALLASLFGYGAAIFFSFSITETQALFWFYAVLVMALQSGFKANEFSFERIGRFRAIGFLMLALVAAIASGQIVSEIFKVQADYYAVKSKFAGAKGDRLGSLDYYQRAIALNPAEEYYRDYYLSELTSYESDRIKLNERFNISSMDLVKSIIDKDQELPDNYFRKMRLLNAYVYFVRQGRSEYLAQAEKASKELIKQYPMLPDPQYYLGLLYYYDKRYADAAREIEKVFPLLPDANSAVANLEHRTAIMKYSEQRYFMLGMAYLNISDYKKSNEAFLKILKVSPFAANVYQYVGWNYYKQKEAAKAIWYYKRAISFNRGNYQLPLQLGNIYLEEKKNKEALEYFKSAQKLNPDDKSLGEAIKKLQ